MKILITGCCGFIGGNLCKNILKTNENIEIFGIDNFNSFIYDNKFKELNSIELIKYNNYKEIRDDLLNNTYICEIKPDIIIHLAGYANVRKSYSNPELYVKNNINVTSRILEDIVKLEYKPLLIYASSSSVYGTNTKVPFKEDDKLENIISHYAFTKKTCEDFVSFYCKNFKIKAIGFRFFSVYGPGGRPDMAIFNFLKNIYEGKEINVFGDGKMARDYTFVTDIVNGIIQSFNVEIKEGEHRIYNLGNNKPITLELLVKTCEEIVGKKAIIKNTSIPEGDVPITYADISKSKNDFEYDPKTNIKEGLEQTYNWFKNNKI